MDESLRRTAIRILVTFVLLSITMTLFVGFYRRTARTRTMTLPFDIAACDDDGDCGLVNQIGCCPCEAGGGQGAVNPRMRSLLRDFLDHACRRRPTCIDVSTCRTDLEPHCQEHECVLVAPANRPEAS